MLGEVSEALKKSSNQSAPGPNQVRYRVWKNIHRIEEGIIPKMVEDMLECDIHPPMLKESIGIILLKPDKKYYTDCESFRVIALMQTFSKITEPIVNQRLMAIAYKRDIYCINQTGSLLQRSTVDAALLLNYWIVYKSQLEFAGKKVSSVFLDVNRGFDNENHKKLLDLLGANEKVPEYLVDWISNFIICTREITLAYLGSPRTQNSVNKSIPQESQLSSVTGLFLSIKNTIGPAIDLLALVLREASRDG